ncbi:hydroxyphenylacetyl-CoA thioesterase PaaI [Duganella sp. LX20W]|uniref:Hydroxyphenylacetyl-CoA thioesterase PaaI n=2 Tax=Rugamonas brunnea TaxID=2758569 RepID=A0A7W2EVW8_9BURK|nr:hydroxyphenylacetyl-CoA thioesterase PaaI [Rugamonas brunnea]
MHNVANQEVHKDVHKEAHKEAHKDAHAHRPALTPEQAQALAEAAGAAMYARDPASQGLGMTLDSIRPGYARMSMPVRADMLNGHQTCHGGFIFALADSAFAFACNSHNQNTVGAGCTIEYLAPGRLGDILTAEAVEQALAGKSGVYDIRVSDQNGRVLALMRGKSHRVSGEVTPPPSFV